MSFSNQQSIHPVVTFYRQCLRSISQSSLASPAPTAFHLRSLIEMYKTPSGRALPLKDLDDLIKRGEEDLKVLLAVHASSDLDSFGSRGRMPRSKLRSWLPGFVKYH